MVGNTNAIREAILATMASTKMFRILTTTNSAELDAIPSANADWVVGIFDPSWANKPSQYGICFRVTAITQPWSWEIAFNTDGSPRMYVRSSINGANWSLWVEK